MNTSYTTDDTPMIDTLQGKIAMLKSGISLSEWARRNGCNQPTAWRALNNINIGPKCNRIRHKLAAFIEQVNNTNEKGK